MIWVILWKEIREQSTVWVALAFGTVALMVLGLHVVPAVADVVTPDQAFTAAAIAAYAMLATSGLVCGSMLLAGEREEGTLWLLDALTGRRAGVWWTKLLAGLVLTSAQTAVTLLVVLLLGMFRPPDGFTLWYALLPPVALVCLVWGFFGSAICRGVLPAAGMGALGLLLAGLATGFLGAFVSIVRSNRQMGMAVSAEEAPFLVFIGLAVVWLVTPLHLSNRVFCKIDREKRLESSRRRFRISAVRLAPDGWKCLLWLGWRQMRGVFYVMAVIAALMGFLLPYGALAVWPGLTLFVGVVFGVSVFGGEQSSGSFKFLGDSRLPPGRLWVMKSGFALLLAATVTVCAVFVGGVHMFLMSWQHGLEHVPGPDVNPEIWLQYKTILTYAGVGKFWTMWLIYGFSAGQLFAMLVRKTIVAATMALGVAWGLAVWWVPSLLSGGLSTWQVFVPPLLLLLGTRLVIWAWMTGCLRTAWPALALSACGVLGAATIAGGIYYRMAEVPDVGPAFDVEEFIASIPTIEANVAGDIIRVAGKRLKEHEQEVSNKTPRPKGRVVLKRIGQFALGDEGPGMMAPGGAGAPPMARVAGDVAGGAGGMMGSAVGPGGWWQETEEATILRLLSTGTLPMPPLTLAGAAVSFGLGVEPRSAREKEALAQDDRAFQVRNYYYQELGDVLKSGWNNEATPGFDRWLNAIFQDKWSERIEELVKLPLGVLENPRNLNIGSPAPALDNSRSIGHLLAGRALQLQTRGDHEGGLRFIATALALSRNLRNKATYISHQIGVANESIALQGLDQWIVGVGANRELLRRALDELDRHERELPPFSDVYKAEYLITQNSLSEVYKWLDDYRPLKHEGGGLQELFRFVGSVPWEQKRRERILNAIYAGWLASANMEPQEMEARWPQRTPRPRDEIDVGWIPPASGRGASITPEELNRWHRESWLNIVVWNFTKRWSIQGRSQANIRTMRIKLAALLYQVEFGKQPEKLGELVPRFMARLPTDPFTGREFGYEIVTERHELAKSGPGTTIVDAMVVDAHVGDAVLFSPMRLRDQGVQHVVVPLLKKR